MLFWELLAAFGAMYFNFLLKNDPDGFKEVIRTKDAKEISPSYDFIIVGAGSADNDGVCSYARGRALGGSSAIGGMMYFRGYKSDYDRWGKDNPGWNFEDVSPYFLKIENNVADDLVNDTSGPVTISYAPYRAHIAHRIIQAGIEMGWHNTKCPDHESDCISYIQSNIRNGRRCSAATAYLEPISDKRDNLDILTNARVTKILMDGNTARGIEFLTDNEIFKVTSKKEVILSAGTIDSPKLLMLSGIGPKNHLTSLGINVVADLPVGNNLQDHSLCGLTINVLNGTVALEDLENGMDEYVESQTGPLASSNYDVAAFSSLKRPGRPLVYYIIGSAPQHNKQQLSVVVAVARPKSVGKIRLRSKDPKEDPLIDSNMYSHEHDFNLTLAGLSEFVDLIHQPSLQEYNAALQPTPSCPQTEPQEDYLKCLIKSDSVIVHPVGTVKMSPHNKGGVVDNKLKVYGINNLRVVDASIAPSIISMNTNPMAIMIGEKGADIIKHDHA